MIALGPVDLAVPRDRKASFEPQLVRTGQGPGCARQPPSHQPGPPPEASRAASSPERLVHRARTGEKYRLSAPLPAAGPTRGTANHTDGVKTSHPPSRKAAHGLNNPGHREEPVRGRECSY